MKSKEINKNNHKSHHFRMILFSMQNFIEECELCISLKDALLKIIRHAHLCNASIHLCGGPASEHKEQTLDDSIFEFEPTL